MIEAPITTAQALQLLRDTPLPEGREWHAQSMDAKFSTQERLLTPDVQAVLSWLEVQAQSAGAPLEFEFMMDGGHGPAFRFVAGGTRMLRVAPVRRSNPGKKYENH